MVRIRGWIENASPTGHVARSSRDRIDHQPPVAVDPLGVERVLQTAPRHPMRLPVEHEQRPRSEERLEDLAVARSDLELVSAQREQRLDVGRVSDDHHRPPIEKAHCERATELAAATVEEPERAEAPGDCLRGRRRHPRPVRQSTTVGSSHTGQYLTY